MSARVSAFVIWSLVAAVVVFWAMRFTARPLQAPPYAVAVGQAAPPRGDLARLFGIVPIAVAATDSAPTPEASSRFRLLGVMAPRGATADQAGAGSQYGLALIAVDGKPPRAFAVGSRLDEGLVLQSVGLRTASIGAPEGARSVLLELPPPGAPATGMLPPPGGVLPGRSGAAPVPPAAGMVPGTAMGTAVAVQPPVMSTGLTPPPGSSPNQPARDLAQ